MFNWKWMHKNESGQAALETAIILIAFVVVASVFAFTILSAGSASTEKGEQAIYSGLQGVQSSMSVKGSIIAEGSGTNVSDVIFTVSLVAGGDPVNLDDAAATKEVVIGYRDESQYEPDLTWTVNWIVNKDGGTADDLLEEGELAELTVDLSGLGTALSTNTAFTLEVKPPTGAVLNINRNTPAAIESVMDLR